MRCFHIGMGRAGTMRTKIEIDDGLMREAMRVSGKRSKRATVEEGLRLLVQVGAQGKIRRLRGKMRWWGRRTVRRLKVGRLRDSVRPGDAKRGRIFRQPSFGCATNA
jgi:Arc/MetJ family transcription regulator